MSSRWPNPLSWMPRQSLFGWACEPMTRFVARRLSSSMPLIWPLRLAIGGNSRLGPHWDSLPTTRTSNDDSTGQLVARKQ